MTKPRTQTVVANLPNCDLCAEKGKTTPAAYDAKLNFDTSWAYVCRSHFRHYGVGLGLGLGQELILAENEES